MSKRNPSRSERFSIITSSLGQALCIVEDFIQSLSDAIKEAEERQASDERAEFKNPFNDEPGGLDGANNRLGEVSEVCECAKNDAEELKEELQNWLDNMPENLQASMKAEQLEEAISSLDEFTQSLDEVDTSDVASLFNGSDSFSPDEMLEALEDILQNIESAQDADVMFPGMF